MSSILSKFPADWPIAIPAYFAVDYDGGSDSNLGFSLVSMAAAGAVALKTFEELKARIPSMGAGRIIIVAVKPRAAYATYRNKANTADDVANHFDQTSGYAHAVARGTTDFSDTTLDKITSGGVPMTSGVFTANVAGYNPTGVPTVSVVPTQLAGGGASGLPAEPGVVGGRVRFDPNTVTVALRNIARMIHASAGDTITVDIDLPAIPAAGDVFYIEEPGSRVARYVCNTQSSSETIAADLTSVGGQLHHVGFMAMATTQKGVLLQGPGYQSASFMSINNSGASFVGRNLGRVRTLPSWTEWNGTAVTTGMGCRVAGSVSYFLSGSVSNFSCCVLGTSTLANIGTYIYGSSSYFGGGIIVRGSGPGVRSDTSGAATNNAIGSLDNAIVRAMRIVAPGAIIAGIDIESADSQIWGVDITNCGAKPCIFINGVGPKVAIQAVTGSAGNTGVGVDCSSARFANIVMGTTTANTVTGTAGDIRVAGTAITTHAGLAGATGTNVIDNQGNNLQGSAGQIVSDSVLVSNQSGVAVAIGEIVRSNGTSGQVTSAQADTAVNAGGPLLAMLTPAASATNGYATAIGRGAQVLFDAAPAAAALAYLDEGTARLATTTVPPAAATNQKRRLGHVVTVSGNFGRVVGSPELLPIISDGVAP